MFELDGAYAVTLRDTDATNERLYVRNGDVTIDLQASNYQVTLDADDDANKAEEFGVAIAGENEIGKLTVSGSDSELEWLVDGHTVVGAGRNGVGELVVSNLTWRLNTLFITDVDSERGTVRLANDANVLTDGGHVWVGYSSDVPASAHLQLDDAVLDLTRVGDEDGVLVVGNDEHILLRRPG